MSTSIGRAFTPFRFGGYTTDREGFKCCGQGGGILLCVRFANNDEVIDIVEYVLYPSLANDPFNTISNCSENNGGLMEAEGRTLSKYS